MLSLTMRKLTIFSLCILVGLAGSASGQEKAPSPGGNGLTAATVLKKNLAATGGLEAFQRLRSMVVRGELGLSNPRSSASVNYFYQAPSSHVVQLRINRIGTLWAGDHEGKAINRSVPRFS